MLAAEGGSKALATHIIELAKTKYAVDLTENDIDSCHYLPKEGILFSLWTVSNKYYSSSDRQRGDLLGGGCWD